MTKEELQEAIEKTEVQEKLFRLAGDHLRSADWILERIKLRGMLHGLLLRDIR